MPHPPHRPRILVVEDEAIAARDIQLQLAALGYEPVGHAKRGEEAVLLAGELLPDLVLMDIQLAGAMNGVEAATLVRQRHSIPVVFLTAFAEDTPLEQAKLAEPFGYVPKPCAERELRIVLEMALYKHHIETALRDSEDRYRSLFNNLQNGVLLVGLQGEVLLANQRACDLLGLGLEELRSAMTQDPGWNLVREDGSPFPDGAHPVAQCLASRKPVSDTIVGVYRQRSQDRLWLQFGAHPRLAPDGSLRDIICTFVDITRRKQVEVELLAGREALRESALHTQTILDNMVDAVITIDRHGLIETFNRAATSIFGYPAKEVIGSNVSMLMADHNRRHHDAYMQHHHGTGETKVIGKVREMLAARKNGQVFPISLAVSRITHLGQVTYIGLIQDITERRRAAEALEEKTQQLRALSRRVLEAQELERRRVAHELHDELGQSLTAIKINLQARERFKDRSPAELNAENLRIVEDALQHVRRLAVALRPSVLDDLGLIPALRGIAEQTAARSGFTVHFEPAIPDTRLPPDVETACFRVVQEALTNITRHARATRVDIDLFHDGEALMLGIHDDGCGFDVGAVRERASAGNSIGLLGMKERATLLGGQLDIESVPGMGSTVRMRCPLALPH